MGAIDQAMGRCEKKLILMRLFAPRVLQGFPAAWLSNVDVRGVPANLSLLRSTVARHRSRVGQEMAEWNRPSVWRQHRRDKVMTVEQQTAVLLAL